MLSTGLGFGYLSLVQLPAYENDMLKRISGSYATQEATSMEQMLQLLRQRINAAALSPLAQQTIASKDTADIQLVEKTLLDFFPEAVSLRLLPLGTLGTAVFEDGNQGLRNHIEVDLVRRTSDGQIIYPESFQFEDKWLTSIAQIVSHPLHADRQAVILITLDNQQLNQQLALIQPDGSAVLQQRYTDSSGRQISQDIAHTGAASSKGKVYAGHADLPEASWRITFTPSDRLISSLQINHLFFHIVSVASMLGAMIAVLLNHMLNRRQLKSETEKLLAASDSNETIPLQLPELEPLAQQLCRPRQQPVSDKPTTGSLTTNNTGRPSHQPPLLNQGAGEESLELELSDDTGNTDKTNDSGPIPEHIFRAYDIRGNAGTELTNALITRIGYALAELVQEHGTSSIILASDGRLSSPRIREKLCEALLASGLNVIDIGLVPTPLLYYATRNLNCRSGIMVTGSHNPASDNGLKIVIDRHTIHAGGIEDIRKRVERGAKPVATKPGNIEHKNIVPAYMDEIASDITLPGPMKVIIDASNGATAEIAPDLLSALGCDVISMNCEIDGNFPDHPPDTSDERNLQGLQAAVTAQKADFGVAFDGDGDRIATVTGSGEIVRSDVLLMLFAQDIVSRNPGADVVFDVKCSRKLAQVITEHGGRPVLCKTGHAFVKEKVAETGALLGGEFSGHIMFGERWYGHDDALYAAGRLAEILSTHDQSLDEAISALPHTTNTAEILIPVEEQEKFPLMQKIINQADFGEGQINTLDGVRVDFPHGWGLLRASNTTAALTARFEADNKDELEKICQIFRSQIARIDAQIKLPF
ncbi:MAG: phosphomannomutase/phosphoglucomutase [Parahaliea sp.]